MHVEPSPRGEVIGPVLRRTDGAVDNRRKAPKKGSNMTDLTVSGMTCGHCKKAVEEALSSVDGVTSVDVDLDAGRAKVEGGNLDALLAAVAEEGYTATPA